MQYFFPLKSCSLFCTHLKSVSSRLCRKVYEYLPFPVAYFPLHFFGAGGGIELFSLIFLTVEDFLSVRCNVSLAASQELAMLKNHKSACSFQTTAVCSNLCNFFSQILLITALLFKWTQWKPHLSSNKLKARSGLLGKEYKFHHEAKWVQAFSLKSLPLQGPVHVNELQQVKRPKEDGQFSEEMYKPWKQRELRSPFRKILEQMLFGKVHREVMGFSQQHTSNHRCLAGTEETSWVLK